MSFKILGDVNKERLYCTGSFTKMLTTFVCLSFFSEKHDLNSILDDKSFFSKPFTIRDLCTHYAGFPYTFDLLSDELKLPFKHHSILNEETFLKMPYTMVYKPQSKFHYSELSIIFLGYLTEKKYGIKIEDLYKKYILEPFRLKNSYFSRTKVEGTDCRDLSDRYDYPSIAIADHGYFCYSNGYFTTLNDQKALLEELIHTDIFRCMTDIKHARAASHKIINGLSVEIRLAQGDIIYGYEGLSYSGCNIWAYSTKQQLGFLTTSDNEEEVYDIIYGALGYTDFEQAPAHTQTIYQNFLKNYAEKIEHKSIPAPYLGTYQRVKINDKELKTIFTVSEHEIEIRNPQMTKYPVVFINDVYRILGKDKTHSQKVGFYDNRYMLFDGILYKKTHT